MNINLIPAGKNIPNDVYAIIEISANTSPVKYEINSKVNALFIDRFIPNNMLYPCNYGYINQTIALDGDPIDILVKTSFSLQPNCIILCRPIGILNMIDESGKDAKIIAVPHNTVSKEFDHIKDIYDLPKFFLKQIEYFFEHYKDLDYGKWVKIKNWENAEVAKKEIMNAYKRNLKFKNQ